MRQALARHAPLLLSLLLHASLIAMPTALALRGYPLPPIVEVEALWAVEPPPAANAPTFAAPPQSHPDDVRPAAEPPAEPEVKTAARLTAAPEPSPAPSEPTAFAPAELSAAPDLPVASPTPDRSPAPETAPVPPSVPAAVPLPQPQPEPAPVAPAGASSPARPASTAPAQVQARNAGQPLAPFPVRVVVPAIPQYGWAPAQPASGKTPTAQVATSSAGGWTVPAAPTLEAGAGAPAAPAEVAPAGSAPAAEPASPPPPALPPGYQPARLARQVKPAYPREARKKGLTGTVHLILQVGPDGRVGKVEVAESSGVALFDEYAAAAARKWRYEPARDNGRPVAETKRVAVVFKLDD